MRKIYVVFLATLFLSGCGSSSSSPTDTGTSQVEKNMISQLRGGIIKSKDAGATFEPIVSAGGKKNLSKVNILTLSIGLPDGRTLYAGSLENGLFISQDAGKTWQHVDAFPGTKVYGIAAHPKNPQIVYASGVALGRAKLFKTQDGGGVWKEVYSEPSDGTVLISLAMDKNNPETLYVGTSAGVTIKTMNGGTTWQNMQKMGGPIASISLDPYDAQTIYLVLFEGGVFLSRDGGGTFHSPTEGKFLEQAGMLMEAPSKQIQVPNKIYSIALDSKTPGTAYFGSDDGVYRARQYGVQWEKLNIIESSSKYPIRALAVSPVNSQEMMYASARALYKTIDEGTNWSVFQLESQAGASVMLYNPSVQGEIYIGLKS